MASFAIVELDTTPPQITWGAHHYDPWLNHLEVEYSLDEQTLVSAVFVDNNGLSHPLVVWPDRVALALPFGYRWFSGQVVIFVRDELGNEKYHILPLHSDVAVNWTQNHHLVWTTTVNEHEPFKTHTADNVENVMQVSETLRHETEVENVLVVDVTMSDESRYEVETRVEPVLSITLHDEPLPYVE